MDYLISQIPLLTSLFAAFVVFTILERIYQPVPYSIKFKSPKAEVLIAVFLYLILVAFAVFAFWQVGSHTPSKSETVRNGYTFAQALFQLLANAMIFLPFGIAMLIRNQGLKTIGISKYNISLSIIGGIIASLFASLLFSHPSLQFWLSASTAFLFIAQLGVGLSEEAIFRGYLLMRFSTYFKRNIAELFTALMFALVHIPQRLFNKSTVTELVVDLVVLFLWGWVFNVIMHRTSNVAGLALLHSVLNVVGV